jgi:hypothetical protein
MSSEEWDNRGALRDNLQKQITYLELANHIQKELEKLKVTEQNLRETIGDKDES